MKKIFYGFALSVSMLTTLPFFRVHDFFKGINGYGVMFYPLVGLLLGLILLGVHTLLLPYLPQQHLGVLLFVLWVVLTGALHLDGLSDTLDGLYVAKECALEVMKDPHVGGMGMLLSGTFLIFKASSLAFLETLYLLPLVLMLSRFNVVLSIYFTPYISKNGMSTLAKEEFTLAQLLFVSLYVFVLGFYFSWVLVLGSLLVLFVCARFFIKRYGGFSGDIYGFMIECSELFLLQLLLLGLY
ncbi:MAG: adenosylcobinamide-GDP ribazoletransferase [Helicobacteraceae bacterium]|nr:adenosylcobinamide-GDP ribazoletransferase [Helicobacteraceae bacterium]